MFPHIQLLLKLSNHAALLLPHHKQSEKQKQLAKNLCEGLFSDFPVLEEMYQKRNFSTMSDPMFCGKMTVLQKLLTVLKNKHDKVLLFSNSTKLLDILEAYVMSRGFIYRRLDGNTNVEYRNIIVKEFNNDASIFICLISTTAGSLGLNFTGANFVIIFDPMWNPSHDLQAQDRAYRIGQQRDVTVYRFISVGTIEENIYMRQIYKQQMANTAIERSTERRYFAGVVGDRRYHGELFGVENIFNFNEDHSSSLARDTFNKVKFVENDVTVAKYEQPVQCTKSNKNLNLSNDNYEMEASQVIDDELTDEGDLIGGNNDMKDIKGAGDPLNPPLIYDNSDTESDSDKITTIKCKQEKQEETTYDHVLANCGVSFVHSTKSVVGSSKKEQQLSKQAINDVFWDGMHSQQPANDALGIQESDESQDIQQSTNQNVKTTKEVTSPSTIPSLTSSRVFERIGSDMFIIGSSPPAFQAKQFKNIAESQGFASAEEFASFVLSCQSNEWKKILRDFHVSREPSVKSVSSFEQIFDCNARKKQFEEESIETCCKRQVTRKKTAVLRNKNVSRKSVTKKRNVRKRSYKKVDWNALFDSDLSGNDDIEESDSDDEKEYKAAGLCSDDTRIKQKTRTKITSVSSIHNRFNDKDVVKKAEELCLNDDKRESSGWTKLASNDSNDQGNEIDIVGPKKLWLDGTEIATNKRRKRTSTPKVDIIDTQSDDDNESSCPILAANIEKASDNVSSWKENIFDRSGLSSFRHETHVKPINKADIFSRLQNKYRSPGPSVLDELMASPETYHNVTNVTSTGAKHVFNYNTPRRNLKNNNESILCSETNTELSNTFNSYSTTPVMETFDSSIASPAFGLTAVSDRGKANTSILDELLDFSPEQAKKSSKKSTPKIKSYIDKRLQEKYKTSILDELLS